MGKDFRRPLSGILQPVPPELIDAQQTLSAKRKLSRILRSRSTNNLPIAPGDFVKSIWKGTGRNVGCAYLTELFSYLIHVLGL